MLKPILSITILMILFAACASRGPYVPKSEAPSIEDTYHAVLLDKSLKKRIAIDHIGCQKTLNDRLEVFANIRNRKKGDIQVQVQTIFKDMNGFSIGEDSAWHTIFLTSNETETYRIVSRSQTAKDYTIRIREVR